MIRFLQTQGRTQKVLLVGFLGLICITMVMYLVPGFNDAFNSSSNPDVVAKVGSHEITGQEVQRVSTSMVRRQFPKGAPPQFAGIFQDQAFQSLVTQNVFLAEAQRLGLEATDAELQNELQHGAFSDQIFPDGNFIGKDQYNSWVQANTGLNVPKFEELVKQDLTIRKLRDVIEGGATVSPADVKTEYLRASTKVKIDYATISLQQVAKTITPSDSELKAYYEKNQKQLANAIPEQRKARYIVVDAAHIPGAKVSDADLDAYYKQHQEEFREQRSAKVRHILIAAGTPGSAPDQKTLDAAKAKADDVLKQVKASNGKNFAELAKKYSDDPGSKDKGGEYPPFVPGQTDPAFDNAIFTGKVGEFLGPVKTAFGYHIIQVENRTEPHLRSLDDVRAQITPIVTGQKMKSQVDALANTLQTQARTQGLDKAAAGHSLQVISTDFFDRGAALPGVGNSPQFADYVFGNAPNTPPTSVQTQQGWAIVQTTDVKAARTPTFEEAKAQLAARYSQERAQSLLVEKTKELADKAHALHNLKEAAKQVGATFKTSDFVAPTQQVPDLGVLGQIVDVTVMKPGEISNAVNAGQSGAVISLVEKQIPTDAEFATSKDQFREQLLGQKRNELLEVYVSTLRDKMEKNGKIKIYQKNLDRLAKNNQPE
jgi:peptidyl-prolyl cis-trans isomerase D